MTKKSVIDILYNQTINGIIVNATAHTVVFIAKQRNKLPNIPPLISKHRNFPCDPVLHNSFNCFPCVPILSNFSDYSIKSMERGLQEKETRILREEYEALSKDKAAVAISLETLGQVRSIRETVRATLAKNEIAVIKDAIYNLEML